MWHHVEVGLCAAGQFGVMHHDMADQLYLPSQILVAPSDF